MLKDNNQRVMNAIIEQNETPSRTTLYDLPMEMLDIILKKSYLHWILNPSAIQRDEEVIRSLISVDVCFNRRINRQRFKKAVWRYLEDFYGKAKKRSAIIRHNRKYFVDNIQPSDELIASLLSLNCITEEQSRFIQLQRSTRDKNNELLYAMESVDERNFSNVVNCLWNTNQKTITKIIENGGGVIKLKAHIRGAKCTASMGTELLHQKIEDLRNNENPMSHQTNKFMVQLREEGIKILSSQLDRHTVVVWIWCSTQTALEHIQKLYRSNQLRDMLFENIQPSISMLINIDGNQFKKTVVERSTSINFIQRIELLRVQCVFGVAKLRNKFYVLCRTLSFDQGEIHVFEDRTPFRLLKEIKTKEIGLPWDIASSEKENCLYISDNSEQCVWKITIEKDDRHVVIKWLTTDYHPRTLSVSSDGQLLLINDRSHSLMSYGSDAELIRSIPLTGHNIKFPYHAVKTSIGNFVVTHTVKEKAEVEKDDSVLEKRERKERVEEIEGQVESIEIRWDTMLVVSELNRDGKTVMRRCIDSNELRYLDDYGYDLSLDSDDRLFMTNSHHNIVGFLDSGLRWNRILYTANGEKEEGRIRQPFRLCYDEEMKQLIVVGYKTREVNVYTLSLK